MDFLLLNFYFLIFLNGIALCAQTTINGRCGRPGLPFNAKLDNVSPERVKFENNETVTYICPSNEFPHHSQTRTCSNGKWIGPQAKCGKILGSQVTYLEIFQCLTGEKLGEMKVNQTEKSETISRTNSYHISRDTSEGIFVEGLDCYRYKVHLDEQNQIAFVLIDLIIQNYNFSQIIPEVHVNVSSALKCELQKTNLVNNENEQIIGYYFFCDLSNKTMQEIDKEKNKNSSTFFSMAIYTLDPTLQIEIGAVFLGSHYYKRDYPSKPECGEIEIERSGVLVNEENNNYYIRCNDSFDDYWLNSNKFYKFVCNQNGRWVGDWPVCLPLVSCVLEKSERLEEKTIEIDEIGNAYFINESEWYAINHTFVKYKCKNKNHVILGNNIRVCQKSGVWSEGEPNCIDPKKINVGIISLISTLLVILIIVITFLILRMNLIKRKLKQRQNIEGVEHSNNENRMSNKYVTKFEEYDDFIDDKLNEDYSQVYAEAIYDTEERYTEMQANNQHDSQLHYLELFEVNTINNVKAVNE